MFDWIVIGTCGNCGGPVKTPRAWNSVMPAPRTCGQCGAQAADYGPVIPMGPPTDSGETGTFKHFRDQHEARSFMEEMAEHIGKSDCVIVERI